jgi:plastocyanin
MTLSSLPELRSLAHAAMVSLGVLTSGCANGTSTDAIGPTGPLTLSRVEGASSGDNQRAMTGETLREPLRVSVTRGGVPVAGVEVTWFTSYGTLAANGPTDARGIASAVWTLPPNLFGTREARVALATDPDSWVRFTSQPSHPTVERVAGNDQAGVVGERLADELVVRVTWDGVPVSGRAVSWYGPEVEETAAVTDAGGMVRGRWRLGPVAGHQFTRLQLSPHAVDGPQAYFGARAEPGPPAAMALFLAQDSVGMWRRGSGGTLPVSAQVRDRYGNLIPQVGVAWAAVSAQGVKGAPTILMTDQAGLSRGQLPIDPVVAQSDFTILASLAGVPSLHRSIKVVDILMMDDGWGWFMDPDILTVPVGTTVSWGNRTYTEHLLSVVTPLSDTTVAIGETIGSMWAAPGHILTHQFHTPGTYVVDCVAPTHFWERITIHVTP